MEQPEGPISSSKILAPNLDTYIHTTWNQHLSRHVTFKHPLLRASCSCHSLTFCLGRIGVSFRFSTAVSRPLATPLLLPSPPAQAGPLNDPTKAVTTPSIPRPNKLQVHALVPPILSLPLRMRVSGHPAHVPPRLPESNTPLSLGDAPAAIHIPPLLDLTRSPLTDSRSDDAN